MRKVLLMALLLPALRFFAQGALDVPTPRLVVGIVVDQMRNEYLYRYWSRFGDDGFRRLVREGYYFRNTHFNYIPTNTAPGHASIYTGTTPRYHGIIANDWFDKNKRTGQYCVFDENVKPVGTAAWSGQMSPSRLLSTTVTDELRLSTMKRGKVYAVALKDRAAVLPAGHMANGAFWLEESTGNFVTSSCFMNELPAWVKEFNESKPVQRLLSKPWNTMFPIGTYTSSLADDNDFESPLGGKDRPVFPYDFSKHLAENRPAVVRMTPYGNTLTREFATRIIEAEGLGTDEYSDFISISFSSTDIIGHAYGPRSIEIEDTYLRLDREIAELLKVLDRQVGKGKYVLFLTADHAACDVAAHLVEEKIIAGHVYEKNVLRELKQYCSRKYQDSALVLAVVSEQVFLDEQRVAEKGHDLRKLVDELAGHVSQLDGIAAAYPANLLEVPGEGREQVQLLSNGYHPRMSGHIAYLCSPGFMDYSRKGTTHGSGYSYDTHVPLLFFGAGIPKGESFEYTIITQIAPTISELLRIARPSASTASPLNGNFRK